MDIKCNTKTNVEKKSIGKNRIILISDGVSRMQICPNKPVFIELSCCLHLPDRSSADRCAALRVCYLWKASGVRDRTRATGYPPGRRGREGGEGEDAGRQTLGAFGPSKLSVPGFKLGRLTFTTLN